MNYFIIPLLNRLLLNLFFLFDDFCINFGLTLNWLLICISFADAYSLKLYFYTVLILLRFCLNINAIKQQYVYIEIIPTRLLPIPHSQHYPYFSLRSSLSFSIMGDWLWIPMTAITWFSLISWPRLSFPAACQFVNLSINLTWIIRLFVLFRCIISSWLLNWFCTTGAIVYKISFLLSFP